MAVLKEHSLGYFVYFWAKLFLRWLLGVALLDFVGYFAVSIHAFWGMDVKEGLDDVGFGGVIDIAVYDPYLIQDELCERDKSLTRDVPIEVAEWNGVHVKRIILGALCQEEQDDHDENGIFVVLAYEIK